MKRELSSEEVPPSFNTSAALHMGIKEANLSFLKLIEIAIQLRNVEPHAGMLIGLSDEVLAEYAKIDKEDWWEMARLGVPLMTPRVNTVEAVRELAATGFSSPQMVANLTKSFSVGKQR